MESMIDDVNPACHHILIHIYIQIHDTTIRPWLRLLVCFGIQSHAESTASPMSLQVSIPFLASRAEGP